MAPDISTDGVFPKAWNRTNGRFYLYKGDVNDSVRKETEATQILSALGIPVLCYEKQTWDGQPISVCACFTSKDINMVSAGDLQNWLMNRNSSLDELNQSFTELYEFMLLADYLVGNADRHQDNWGYLYNEEQNITGMYPLMDFNHAFEATPEALCLPEQLSGRKITHAEMARSLMKKYRDKINITTDLSQFHYGGFVKERLRRII